MVESFSLNANAIKQIEELIKKSGLYGSKSEFYREAVREKTLQLIMIEQDKVRKRGYKGGFPSREERIKIANEYLMEHGFQPRQAK